MEHETGDVNLLQVYVLNFLQFFVPKSCSHVPPCYSFGEKINFVSYQFSKLFIPYITFFLFFFSLNYI